MKKALVAVDDSRGSLSVVERLSDFFSNTSPEKIVLLYVEKIEGKSLMDEMLGDAELSTLKIALKETDYQEALDKKAKTVLDFFEKALKEKGFTEIKRVVKEGHPADEILATAKEENVELIVVGSRGKRLHTFLMGSVSREVSNRSGISVLIAR